MQFPSKLIENAVQQIAKLPGIGKKSALRIALHLLKQDESYSTSLSDAIAKLRKDTTYCTRCHNFCDQTQLCRVCQSRSRDTSLICVVESPIDLMAIENTGSYNGLYHVLGGLISPVQGVGPDKLQIDSLIERSLLPETKEIILALSATIEGDTTAFYLRKKIQNPAVALSALARGVPFGGELEFTDEVTLSKSLATRIAFGS